MNKKTTVISVIIAIAIVFACGLFEQNKQKLGFKGDAYYSVADSDGGIVEFYSEPQKVAVLFSSLAHAWSVAGGDIAVTVGESVQRGICDSDVLLVDGGAGKTIDTELLVSYEPDLVIYSADVPGQVKAAQLMKDNGVNCLGVRLDSFEDYLKVLDSFCGILGTKENYEKYGKQTEKRINEILSLAAKQQEKKILFIRSGSSESSAKAKKAGDNFAAQMLEDLGCFNIADNAPVLLDGLSVEEVLVQKPEYIFISIMGDEKAGKAYMNSVLESEAWKNVEAQVVFLPKDMFQYKPCENWDKAYEYLYDILFK